jgi:glycosyltransferase involved in cell wall biosynthesis
MDITVLVRARDEELRIARFCESYKDATRILVADGGSVDRTKEIASRYSNVIVRDYPGRQLMQDGSFRNNDSDHINWLIDWSKEYHNDFLILDDCDCFPNCELQRDYREILSKVEEDYVMVTRIYFWGVDQHFPHMAKPGADHTKWEPSLWAWKGSQNFRTNNVPPAFTFQIDGKDIFDIRKEATIHDLFPPYALLHMSWDDSDRVNMKVKNYRESGLIPTMAHPISFAGPLAPLEWWMK